MEDGGNSAKRKACLNEEEDSNDEEAKMEKFFELIRNIREARERILSGSSVVALKDQGEINKKKKRKVFEGDHNWNWKPSLQPQDLDLHHQPAADDHSKLISESEQPAAASKENVAKQEAGPDDHHKKDGERKEEVDLRLSL